MTGSDTIDGKIREALAEVVAHAPLAPEFHGLNEQDRPRQPQRMMSVAGAVAILAVVAVFAVIRLDSGEGDTRVGTAAQPEPSEGITDDSGVAPTVVVTTTIPASTMEAYNAVRSAVTGLLPRFPVTLGVSRNASATSFDFGSEGDDATFTLDVYDSGAFAVGEMETLPELKTGTEDRAWLGSDDPDLRSVYYFSESGLGLRVASDATGRSETMKVGDLVDAAAELSADPAVSNLGAKLDGE